LVFWLTILASIIGVFAYRRYARNLLYSTGQMLPTGWPSLAILIVPGVIMYFLLGQPVGLERPELKGFNFQGGVHLRLSLIALWFALAIYTGAFIAENVRAGIQAISKGQTEAAAALGLRPGRIMNLVILPQALRVIIPPLISQYLNITKNSSLAIAVGYMDITGTLGGITLNQTGRAIEAILLLMLFYLTVSLTISMVMNIYNNSVKLKER
jgi:general L-amino acid transport system permease protein